jgi:hypothetical protein
MIPVMLKNKLHLTFAIVLAIFSASALTSCQTEGCTDPQSDNYDPKAKVSDGSCVPWRDKFSGNFNGNNACAGSADQVITIVITPSATQDDGVVISVPSAGLLFTATVAASAGLTIPKQTINYQGSTVDITGSGTLENESELSISYFLSSGPLTVPCTLSGNQL